MQQIQQMDKHFTFLPFWLFASEIMAEKKTNNKNTSAVPQQRKNH